MKTDMMAVVVGVVLGVGAVSAGAKWLSEPGAPRHTITVTGESRLVGEPDVARVMFGVQQSGPTASEALEKMSAIVGKVVAAADAAGVRKADVATQWLQVSQGWDQAKNKPSGYNASCTLAITVRDVQRVGRVVDAAIGAGVTRLQAITYDVRNPDWKHKALREAAADARSRAESLAAGAGRRLGRVLWAREVLPGETWPAGFYYRPSAASEDSLMSASPRTRSLPGERAMTVQVEVAFAL